METIAQHIAYLLRHHDCVVVPGFGAFIAQRSAASLNVMSHTFEPPARMLGFNPEITHDDGLLISSVARKASTSYQQAQQTVTTAVDAMRRQLIAENEIAIRHVGHIHREDDGRLTFMPFTRNTAQIQYLSLQQLHLTPVNQHITELTGNTVNQEASRQYRHPLGRNWMKIAASIMLLLCMGMILSTPVELNDSQLASLGTSITVHDSEPDVIQDETSDFSKDIVPTKPGAVLNIAIPTNDMASVPARNESVHTSLTATDDTSAKYYLIVASLPSRKLAEKFIASGEDDKYPMGIIHKDGRYRVYAAQGATPERLSATATDEDFIQRYPDAWIYLNQ